ncbi:hypothetical protein BAE44_0022952 [Dichanthelium oligosanthes]|uniref:RING-type E3 ubiquitin transferase n=1 Tax=Dichanthelium oligosanthes TaxID=888268 RepID=A0A1E5UT41_9POAL|nr:hypothetical protein BAE44_0022952 [Dichanthelium oligosanthes]
MAPAVDWVTRACALAIATAACIGLPGTLVCAIVRMAAARRFGATFAFATVLVFWATVSAAYYPRICLDLVPWSDLARWCLRRPCWRGILRQRPRIVVAAASSRQRGGRGRGMMMPALPREPPAVRGCARVVAADDNLASSFERQRNGALVVPLSSFVPRGGQEDRGGMGALLPCEPPPVVADDALASSYERRQRDGGAAARAPDDGDGEASNKQRCAVCLCDVEKWEAATWLPACAHMFHQHCIDQWLHLHGHSTCPICRCDAFVAQLPV